MRRVLSLTALLVFLPSLLFAQGRRLHDYPKYEITFGIGGASGYEDDIFNLQFDNESSPDGGIVISGRQNLDERVALGLHIFGVAEETPTYVVLDPQNNLFQTTFDLATVNFGVDGRYTFSRGPITPYMEAGFSIVSGSADNERMGTLNLAGFSMNLSPGATFALSRTVALGLHTVASFGSANWEKLPFANSNGRDFNPTIVGGFATVTVMWRYE